jgi:3-oxoadipate enol-lactonase
MNSRQARTTSPRGECFHVATASGPLNCRVDGNADGPTIVFSNSHATDLSLWSNQIDTLKERFNLVRYDQRGHGATPVSSASVTFDSLAADVVAILDAFAIERAVLVGVSMGAVTMLRCAALQPSRVTAVFASDGQWAAPANARDTWDGRIRSALGEGMDALVEPTLVRWFTAASLEQDATGVRHARRMIAATSPTGYAEAARAMQAYDFRADYMALRMPVQYVVGANDGTLPAVMPQMCDATPHAQLLTIPDAGHLPNLERPQAFNDALLNFVAQHAQPQHGSL